MGLFKRPMGRPRKNPVELTATNVISAGDKTPYDVELARQQVEKEQASKEQPRFNVEYEPEQQTTAETPKEPPKMLNKAELEAFKAVWADVEPYLSIWTPQEVGNISAAAIKTIEVNLLSGVLMELKQLRAVLERLESQGAQ